MLQSSGKKKVGKEVDPQWAQLARNDWGEILELLQKKTFQRKFQIIEGFTALIAEKGFHRVTHPDLAKKCKISRPLIAHHFPSEEDLISLSYRAIYARFQKFASDAVMARTGFHAQLGAYVDAVAEWINLHHSDARFLVQFYAMIQTSPKYRDLHERNIAIGRERIVALCEGAKKQGLLSAVSSAEIFQAAYSVQKMLLGFIVMHSTQSPGSLTMQDRIELKRSVLTILRA